VLTSLSILANFESYSQKRIFALKINPMKGFNFFIFTFIFCTFIPVYSFTQEDEETEQRDTLHLFQKDEISYILFDSINIRETPSLQGKIVTKLPIGTQVRITGKSTNCLYLNGVKIPWYKIEFGKNQEGYIWGGKLSLAAEKSAKNTKTLFLFGIEKAGSNHLFYTVKAIQNNKEVSSVTVKGFTGILKDHSFELLSNKGLENVDDIINIHGYGGFCGDDSGQHVLFWAKEKLHYVELLHSGFDAPYFYTESFVYPSEIEGEKGIILKHIYSGEYSDDYEDDWGNPAILLSEDSYKKFKWNGTALLEVN
jgi:uncharacterized protein YgiM (DUF1202 family)